MSQPDPNADNQRHAIAYGALLMVLIDKGVITDEEYGQAVIKATQIMDQEFAQKRDEATMEDHEGDQK